MTLTHHFSNIIVFLSSLHRLPERYRIQFEINLLTYKVYKTNYPIYLKDCVQPYRRAYSTRQSEPPQHMLNVPYYYDKQHKLWLVRFKNEMLPSHSRFIAALDSRWNYNDIEQKHFRTLKGARCKFAYNTALAFNTNSLTIMCAGRPWGPYLILQIYRMINSFIDYLYSTKVRTIATSHYRHRIIASQL